IEGDNRIFPESNSSQTIIDTLVNEVANKKFEVKTQSVVLDIKQQDGKYVVTTNTAEYVADYVIYTTGSSPKSLKLIKNLGHKIAEPVPSLFTFNIKNDTLK